MKVTRSWRVYGADGHTQRESYNKSYKYDFSDIYDGTRIIEVLNADMTGTHEYSVVIITRDTYDECEYELNGQLTDGIFENCVVGKVIEDGVITPTKTPPVDNEVDIDDRLNNLWKEICGCLMAYGDDVDNHGFWSDGDQILCPTKIHADVVADFLEALGFGYLNSGYYDPAEDERNDEVDEYTGYWYVQ